MAENMAEKMAEKKKFIFFFKNVDEKTQKLCWKSDRQIDRTARRPPGARLLCPKVINVVIYKYIILCFSKYKK